MRLGQDLAQVLGEGRAIAFTRIEGGFALQTSGAALALLDDRVMVIHWARAEEDLRRVQECVTRSLGAAFLVEDARKACALGRSDHLGIAASSPKPSPTMTLMDLDQSLTAQPPDDRHTAASGPDDENTEPNM